MEDLGDTENTRRAVRQLLQEEQRRQPYVGQPPEEHQKVLVALPGGDAEIDTEMVEPVLWLNSLPGITTVHCCHGEVLPPNSFHRPMVVFTAEDHTMVGQLAQLLDRFHTERSAVPDIRCAYFSTELRLEWFSTGLRYWLYWHDRLALGDFMEWLKAIDR